MPAPRRRLRLAAEPVRSALAVLRDELDVPGSFAPEVQRTAAAATDARSAERVDARDLPLIAVDPVGAQDLDQALAIDEDGSGWVLHYAIADVAAFVGAGDDVDLESWRRGVTCYLPDGKAALHPEALSEGAASLLPGVDRPAVLWRLRIDRHGSIVDVAVERALVRVRLATSYDVVSMVAGHGRSEVEASAGIDLQEPAPDVVDRAAQRGVDLRALVERMGGLGGLLLEREAARGGVSLPLPEQDVVVTEDGRVDLRLRPSLVVEEWNAQLSLATGMAAAQLMLEHGVGLLRTLPPPERQVLDELRARSESLGHPWPVDGGYPAWVRSLDPATPVGMALLTVAGRGLRGAGYEVVDGTGARAGLEHAAVAAPYAHVTAPLRRLGDRYATEAVLAATHARPVPAWVRDGLDRLPEALGAANQRGARVDRAVVDLIEAAVLAARVGEVFDAVVLDRTDGRARLQLVDLPVLADATVAEVDVGGSGPDVGTHGAGTVVQARLVEADPMTRTTRFALD